MGQEQSNLISLITNLVLSGALLIVSIYFSLRGVVKNKQEVTLNFLNEWRDMNFRDSQQYALSVIAGKLKDDPDFVLRGYRGLDKEDKPHVLRVSFFFDYVGNMLAAKAIDKKLILTVISRPIINHWLVLRPLLRTERKLRQLDVINNSSGYMARYQAGFEHVYLLAIKFQMKKALKHLQDEQMNSDLPFS